MALDTYAALKLEIIAWSHRGDIDLKVDTFINMAEVAMFSNPDEVLQVRGQETRSTLVTSGQYLALPADYHSMRSIRLLIPENDQEIFYRSPSQMIREPAPGRPFYFTVTSEIEFNRVPDTNYNVEIQYYAKPTALSVSNASNEVLASDPNIYLFGALAACFIYANDSIEAQKYNALFISAVKGANKKFKRGRYGPAPALTPAGTVV